MVDIRTLIWHNDPVEAFVSVVGILQENVLPKRGVATVRPVETKGSILVKLILFVDVVSLLV